MVELEELLELEKEALELEKALELEEEEVEEEVLDRTAEPVAYTATSAEALLDNKALQTVAVATNFLVAERMLADLTEAWFFR